jgi:hypothetical protein
MLFEALRQTPRKMEKEGFCLPLLLGVLHE